MAGKATGERIKGSVYRQIVQLAINGAPINSIARTVNVHWTTAKAIIDRESKPIMERKSELADACYRVAYQATERLEDNLHNIPPAQLATVAGIMTDKVVNLTQEPVNSINQHLHVHLNQSNMIEQFNALVDRINGNPANADITILDANQLPNQLLPSDAPLSDAPLSCANQNVTAETKKESNIN